MMDDNPLISAVKNNNLDEVKKLVQDRKVDLNVNNGEALKLAAENSNVEIIKEILARRGKGKVEDGYVVSALKILVDNNTDEDTINDIIVKGRLKFANVWLGIWLIITGYPRLAEMLSDNSRNPEKPPVTDIIPETLKPYATGNVIDWDNFFDKEREPLSVLEQSYDESGNYHSRKDSKGRTAIIFAIKSGDLRAVEKLLEHGANLNEVDNYRNTPLMYAVLMNRLDVVRMLIKNGAKINEQNVLGKTAHMYATEQGSKVIAKELESEGAIKPESLLKIDIDDETEFLAALHEEVEKIDCIGRRKPQTTPGNILLDGLVGTGISLGIGTGIAFVGPALVFIVDFLIVVFLIASAAPATLVAPFIPLAVAVGIMKFSVVVGLASAIVGAIGSVIYSINNFFYEAIIHPDILVEPESKVSGASKKVLQQLEQLFDKSNYAKDAKLDIVVSDRHHNADEALERSCRLFSKLLGNPKLENLIKWNSLELNFTGDYHSITKKGIETLITFINSDGFDKLKIKKINLEGYSLEADEIEKFKKAIREKSLDIIITYTEFVGYERKVFEIKPNPPADVGSSTRRILDAVVGGAAIPAPEVVVGPKEEAAVSVSTPTQDQKPEERRVGLTT